MHGTMLASLSLVAVGAGRMPAIAEPVAPSATMHVLAEAGPTERDREHLSQAARPSTERSRDRITIRMSPLQLGNLPPEAFGDWSQSRN